MQYAPPPPRGAGAPPLIPSPPTEPPPPDQIPTNIIWVGFSGTTLPEDDIRPVFEKFGPLELIKSVPQKSCMFVHYVSKQDAWRCVMELTNRPVTVNGMGFRVGYGRAPNDPRGGPGGGGPMGDNNSNNNNNNLPLAPASNVLWLGSLSPDMTEDDLYAPFSRFGNVESVRIIAAKKCAFVTFSSVAEAEAALQGLQGQIVRGERLKINFGHAGSRDRVGGGGGTGGVLKPIGGLDDGSEARLAPVAEVAPPANKEIAQAIDELAKFVHRLGPAFEEKVKDNQKANPRFEFLFGGPGVDYYEWRKYDLREKENASTSHLAPWQRAGDAPIGSGPAPDPTAVALSQAELRYLDGLLQRLQPTQESIKEAKDWIMGRARLANDVVAAIRSKIQSLEGGFSPRLHILYLVNDLLLHSAKAPQDYFGPAFQRSLLDLCLATAGDRVASDDQRKQVLGLIGIWETKGFYSSDFLNDIRAKLESDTGSKRTKTGDPWAYSD